jgi:hypothetical protein
MLRAIDVLDGIRLYASGLVLACVALYFWDALAVRARVSQRESGETATRPSLSLEPEPDEA